MILTLMLALAIILCMVGFYLVGKESGRIDTELRIYGRISKVLDKHGDKKSFNPKLCLSDLLDALTDDVHGA